MIASPGILTSQGTQRIRDSLIGTALVGEGGTRFHVRSLLGEGGQGWVFKANYDDPDGFLIVVKILRPEGINAETIGRFERETRVLQMLGAVAAPNPNIVRFYDHGLYKLGMYGTEVVLPFIALEFVDGPTLAGVLDENPGRGLPLERAVRLMKQVARALHTVHEHRIVHRDLKPSNILLASQQGREVAKVTDFGLVKAPGLSAKATATIAGATLGYAPPEQYEMGNSRVTARTDVFSFAAILFETLSGRAAFPHPPGDSPLRTVARMLSGERPQLAKHAATLSLELRHRPEVIATLDAQFARALAADPEQRHDSVHDLWNALEPVLRGVGAHAMSVSDELVDRRSNDSMLRAQEPAEAKAVSLAADGVLRFQLLVPPMPRERLRGGAFSPDDGSVYAVGMNGLYRARNGVWTHLPLPPGLDARRVRGVTLRPDGELLVFGEAGLCAAIASAGVRFLPGADGDFNWLSAFTTDGDCLLAGERRSRPVGVVAEVGSQSSHVHRIEGTTRLFNVTRLASGTLLACGSHGDLVHVRPSSHDEVSWGKTGHLYALARTESGGAYAVGSGGHAINVSTATEITREPVGDLVATLEAVQTTRDLVAVTIDPNGVAWAVGQSARLLERKAGTWIRHPVVGTESNLVALRATARGLTLLSEDGAVIEATR